jgi:glycosyltransferase involved in cell wall biosynthesis
MRPRRPDDVAVVIPAYCSEDFIEAAVESILAQTHPACEVLVVDDGSPVPVAPLLERYAPLVRVIRQDNGGPAAARNTGIREATAPLIAFLDADDLWEPQKLERQVAEFGERPELGMVCSDALLLRGEDAHERKWGAVADRGAPDLSFAGLLLANPISTLTVMARRELVLEVGLFDEDRRLIAVEDYDLWLRIAERAPIAWIDEPLARYRVHESSLSSTATFLRGVRLVLDKLRRRHPAPGEIAPALRRREAELWRDEAWSRLEAGDVRGAAEPLLEALARQPGHAQAWRLVARMLVQRSGGLRLA